MGFRGAGFKPGPARGAPRRGRKTDTDAKGTSGPAVSVRRRLRPQKGFCKNWGVPGGEAGVQEGQIWGVGGTPGVVWGCPASTPEEESLS